jgi:hypothetical protein
MPTIQDSGAIISSINADLADNNAGLISAFDVRHNMEDVAASIPNIVSLSDTKNTYYFRNDVLISGDVNSIDGGASDKKIITEGGISFPNSPTPGTSYPAPQGPNWMQIEPYPGAGNIDHGNLSGLGDDDHLIYLNRNGSRGMLGNLKMNDTLDAHWVGPNGNDEEGINFTYDSDGKVVINTSGAITFEDGSSIINASGSPTAKGIAKAWCNFNASGDSAGIPAVRSSYNIHSLERQRQGVIKITFASGTFADNNYVAIGNSNALYSDATEESFDINTVGLVRREGDDQNALRSIYYVIRSDDNEFVDAKVNDLVVFGLGPNVTADPVPATSNVGP